MPDILGLVGLTARGIILLRRPIMQLSELAQRVLRAHAREPNRIYYADEVLGSMFRDSDEEQLDQAYRELEASKLMEKSGATISYFGRLKSLYRITEEGSQMAKSNA